MRPPSIARGRPVTQTTVEYLRPKYQPRYLAYAKAHKRTPEEMKRHDREHWPGGINTGFILWISASWSEWLKMHSRKRDSILSEEDHEMFTRWVSDDRNPGCRGGCHE